MNNLIVEQVKEFVTPYYANKDMMHNLNHIERVIKQAYTIGKYYDYNESLLLVGAYLHGLVEHNLPDIEKFLNSIINDKKMIVDILVCAKESDKNSNPDTIEGKILHDAHVLEGGIYFSIVKSLITGSLRSQTLEETLSYYKNNILDNRKCFLPESIELLKISDKENEKILESLIKNAL